MAKKKNEKKIQPLRAYLLKKTVTSYCDALKDGITLEEYALKRSLGIKGKFFLRPSLLRTCEWSGFIQAGISKSLPKIQSKSNAGVLFLDVDNRIFAFVFGTGRYLLKDTSYEPDFGLLSTLNAVDPETLDQVDVNWFGEMVVQKRVQVSRKTSLAAFDIDVNRERFRSITGKAKNQKMGGRLFGSGGGFGVHSRTDFKDLSDQCKLYLNAYNSTVYKKTFPKYDDFNVVKDVAKIKELNARLVSKLKSSKTSGLTLSPPEIISFDDFGGFSITKNGEIREELDIEFYLSSSKDFSKLDIQKLKSHRVYLRGHEHPEPLDKWSVYRCLICEINTGQYRFILWDGQWFRISKKFADKVQKTVESIPRANTCLPSKTRFRLEAPYLNKMAKDHNELALMDQKNIWCNNAGSEMEVCDLFSTKRQFIHVKRRAHGASGLSHLFSQGCNSAQAFLKDESFRIGTKEKLGEIAAKFSSKIPINKPTSSKFEIVYVVMGKARGKFIKELPFFSQLSLLRAYEDLQTMGYKVSYHYVEAPE